MNFIEVRFIKIYIYSLGNMKRKKWSIFVVFFYVIDLYNVWLYLLFGGKNL